MVPCVGQDSLRPIDCIERLLQNDPQLRVQRTMVAQQEGVVRQTRAPFDLTTSAGILASRDYTPLVSPLGIVFPSIFTSQYSVGLSQLLPLGTNLTVTTGVQSQDIESDSISDTRLQNRGFVALNVAIPLLRNRGGVEQRLALDGATLELDAVHSDVMQAINVRVADVLSAYLDVWYNHRIHLMTQEMEAYAQRTYEIVKEYVNADLRPAADLRQAQSNVLSRTRDRIAARQTLLASHAQLLIVMGDTLPSDFVPPAPVSPTLQVDSVQVASINVEILRVRALTSRPDIRGLALRRQTARTLMLAAQQRLEPQLDLGLTLGSNGFNYEKNLSRFISAIGSNTTPLNASLRLDWTLPVQNSEAQGAVQVQQAEYERSSIREQDIIRTLDINCQLATERLKAAYEGLEISLRHVDLARAVLEDAEVSMRNAASTLVDLNALQSDLVSARMGLYSARRDMAAAIIEIRFLASMFFRDNGSTLSFNDQTLYDLTELMR
jgi:outer membrane protein TolC